MHELLTFTIIGIFTGAAYAVAASGLVVTYSTSGIFNIGHGAIGMVMAFVYWQFVVPWQVPQIARPPPRGAGGGTRLRGARGAGVRAPHARQLAGGDSWS